MIVQLNSYEKLKEFDGIIGEAHPQAAKIRSIYRQYGFKYDVYRFFGIYEENRPVGIILLKYNTAIVYAPEYNDLSEFRSFLEMSEDIFSLNVCGNSGRTEEGSNENIAVKTWEYFRNNMPDITCEYGLIMKKVNPCVTRNLFDPPLHIEETRDYLRVFSLLKDSFGGDCYNESGYMTWHCEISHAVRHGHSKVYMMGNGASVTVQCIDDELVILSQLGVTPLFRGKGMGSYLVENVSDIYLKKGLDVFVYSQSSNTDDFYKNLGFVPIDKWYEYYNLS